MAIKNEYVLNFKSQGVKKTKDEVDKLDDSTDKLSKTSKNKLTPALKATKVAFAAIGTAMVASAAYAVQTAAQFEKLRTRLNTMYGSVNEGTKAFNTFNKVAATTPFALQSVVEAGASLKAFGVDAEKNIKPVADLAAFMGLDIVEAASAMGRAFAGGAGAADILRERGVLQLIKDFKGIDDLSKLTLPEFRQALEEAMLDPTLGIAGATDALSETFVGSYSNMMDSVDRLAASFGDKLLPITKQITKIVGGLADEMSGSQSAFEEQIDAIETQQIKLLTLNNTLQDSEFGSRLYNDTLKELKRTYPDLLKGLDDHEINQDAVNGRVDEFIPLLEEKIRLLKEEATLEATRQQQIDTQKKLFEAQTNTAEALVATEDALKKVFYQITDHLAGSESFDSMTKLSNLMEDLRNATIKFKEDGDLEDYYNTSIGVVSDFKDELGNLAKESSNTALIQTAIGSILGPLGSLFGFATSATADYSLNSLELNGVLENLKTSFEDLGLSQESYEIVMAMLDEKLKETKTNVDDLTDSVNNLEDSFKEGTEDGTKKSLIALQKFGQGFNKITKAISQDENELLKHSLDAAGAIGMAMADNRAEQLKIQKFMIQGNVAKGIIDIFSEAAGKGPAGYAAAVLESATLVARGITQTKNVDQQIAGINASKSKVGNTQTRFAQYGMNEVVDQATPIIAGEAGAELVQITPLEGANVDGPQGGGSIVITGNVLSRDFVQGELIDELREAIRQGYDFR